MGLTDRPQLPGQQPLPEPPGNDFIRQILMRRIMSSSINPYGMSPEGAQGLNGQLFSTGLNPAPAFGMTSRGDMGDPNFRQSFLGGPQFPTGGGPRQRMGPMQRGGQMQASPGGRVPLMAGSRSSLPTGGSEQSLLQMLMALLGNSGPQAGGQSFYDGRRVSRGRFYDGEMRRKPAGAAPRPPIPNESGQMGNVPRQVDDTANEDRNTQRASRGGGGVPGMSGMDWQQRYLSGANSGQRASTPHLGRSATNWRGATPFSGTWQRDANGMPIGPGGLQYTGAQHEFSGGQGGSPGAANFRMRGNMGGGPSYAQWLAEIVQTQMRQRNANAPNQGDARARLLEQIGNPDSGMSDQARNWYAQHPVPGMNPEPPLPPPAEPPIPNSGPGNEGSPY